MISAKEARTISGPTVDEQLKELLDEVGDKVKSAAEIKKRQVIIRDSPYADWAYSLKNDDKLGNMFMDELKSLGYETETFYREAQFVDVGLIIKW